MWKFSVKSAWRDGSLCYQPGNSYCIRSFAAGISVVAWAAVAWRTTQSRLQQTGCSCTRCIENLVSRQDNWPALDNRKEGKVTFLNLKSCIWIKTIKGHLWDLRVCNQERAFQELWRDHRPTIKQVSFAAVFIHKTFLILSRHKWRVSVSITRHYRHLLLRRRRIARRFRDSEMKRGPWPTFAVAIFHRDEVSNAWLFGMYFRKYISHVL